MSALNKKSFLTYLKEGGIYVVLLVLLAIIIFQDPTFLSLLNLSNILTQSSVRIIIALGVAGLIVTQGTDLSAGRQVGLAAVVAATLLQSMDNANKVFPEMATMPIALVILIVCAIGAVIGLINRSGLAAADKLADKRYWPNCRKPRLGCSSEYKPHPDWLEVTDIA